MRHSINPKLSLLLLLLCICFTDCLILKPNEKQVAILQKTVKELLDFEQLPGEPFFVFILVSVDHPFTCQLL